MAGHNAGDPLECFSIPIVLHKDLDRDDKGNPVIGQDGKQRYRCGFRIGGGIDQDNTKSPQGYPDKGIYVTYIHDSGPASRCGLQVHDKLLQVNGHDFTVVTHKKAVEYIQRKPVLNMLVYRRGLPQPQRQDGQQTQFQSFSSTPEYSIQG
ncbi:tax1-binding protein 3 homolog [Ruditapes philippinarum]|uniref:tax1-binding protein 3 homolog n=1 Tax=Ruditapes philippinarum TaxID=129788 RepID=UPI00295ADA12|nr:tax1-binding protein 3 homolog [Ruditapes philippinarum]